jgi:hypothetical protein
VRLTIGRESGRLVGQIGFGFRDSKVYFNANPDAVYSPSICSEAVSTIKGVAIATCRSPDKPTPETMSFSYDISFDKWSLQSYENNLYNHTGNPSIVDFECSIDKIDDEIAVKPYCEVSDVVTEKVPGLVGLCFFVSIYIYISIVFT